MPIDSPRHRAYGPAHALPPDAESALSCALRPRDAAARPRSPIVWSYELPGAGTAAGMPPPPLLVGRFRPGQVRRQRVNRDSELTGPVAYGRAGQVWKLYNRARFLIRDVGTSVRLDVCGGNR